jgi:hypothetical protein
MRFTSSGLFLVITPGGHSDNPLGNRNTDRPDQHIFQFSSVEAPACAVKIEVIDEVIDLADLDSPWVRATTSPWFEQVPVQAQRNNDRNQAQKLFNNRIWNNNSALVAGLNFNFF